MNMNIKARRPQVDLNKMVSVPKHIWGRGCQMSGVNVQSTFGADKTKKNMPKSISRYRKYCRMLCSITELVSIDMTYFDDRNKHRAIGLLYLASPLLNSSFFSGTS